MSRLLRSEMSQQGMTFGVVVPRGLEGLRSGARVAVMSGHEGRALEAGSSSHYRLSERIYSPKAAHSWGAKSDQRRPGKRRLSSQ